MTLSIKDLSCGYGDKKILGGVSFRTAPREVLCLLGPNGVGKTTFFKTLLGLIPPLEGELLWKGENLKTWSSRKRARRIGWVPQSHTLPFSFSVLEMVLMGRTAHMGLFAKPSSKDRELALEALENLGAQGLAKRLFGTLSGGERQIVLIARALAQKPDILIMDEPTANLDFKNRHAILELISCLKNKNLTVFFASHAPEQALDVADRTVLFGPRGYGGIGRSSAMVTSEALSELYGMPVELVMVSPKEGKSRALPLARGKIA